MKLVKGTIVCPFIDKGIINERWTKNFIKNFSLDPKEWKFILFDGTKGIGQEYYFFIIEHFDFAAHQYLQYPNRINKEHRSWYPLFLRQGTAIGHVWADTREHIEGNLVLMLEDDILFPRHGWEALIHTLESNSEIGMVAAVQRFKPHEKSPTAMLAWAKGQECTDDYFADEPVKEVRSTATGMCITYADLYKIPDMSQMTTEYHASQDIAYSRWLEDQYGLKTFVDSRVEVAHHTNDRRKVGKQKAPPPLSDQPNTEFSYTVTSHKNSRTNGAPIFLCGFTGRSGTTWVQRIFMSHPDIMMYGEPQGSISVIDNTSERLFGVSIRQVTKNSKQAFERFGAGGFIPNLQPHVISSRTEVRRQIMNAIYGHASKTWGIKTIDWSPDLILRMYKTFPKATFIFITRDLDKLKPSFESVSKQWWGTEWSDALKRIEIMRHFVDHLPPKMHHFEINHSHWEDKQESLCDFIEEKMNFSSGSLSREVATVRIKYIHDRHQRDLRLDEPTESEPIPEAHENELSKYYMRIE